NGIASAATSAGLPDLDARNDNGFEATLSSNSVAWSDGVALTYRVSNWGPGDAPASSTRIYLSTDTVFSADDVLVTSDPVDALAANPGVTQIKGFVVTAAPGNYYVIAVADGGQSIAEGDETNNASNAVPLTVTNAGTLSIDDVSVTEGNDGTK